MKIPGIIGGLGPETTARIYLALVVQEANEYPEILISNVSFPKHLEEEIAVKGGDSNLFLPFIMKSVNRLKLAGADFIVIPCNTLHCLLPHLQKSFDIKFIDLIEETSKLIKEYKKIGIICTTKTRNEKLYDKLINAQIIYPDSAEQQRVSEIIVKIIRNKPNLEDKDYLTNLIERMIKSGAEKVVLACTDLANVIKSNKNTLDGTEILINAIKKEMKS